MRIGLQDLVALAVVAVAVVYAGRSLWRTLHGETGCGGECASKCTATGDAGEQPAVRRTLKRLPLVTLDEMTKPAHPRQPTQPSGLEQV
jgi:hypothetical protein